MNSLCCSPPLRLPWGFSVFQSQPTSLLKEYIQIYSSTSFQRTSLDLPLTHQWSISVSPPKILTFISSCLLPQWLQLNIAKNKTHYLPPRNLIFLQYPFSINSVLVTASIINPAFQIPWLLSLLLMFYYLYKALLIFFWNLSNLTSLCPNFNVHFLISLLDFLKHRVAV